MRVEFDAHPGQGRSGDNDLSDTVKLRQTLLQNIARIVIHLTRRLGLRCQGKDKDGRVGGIDLAIDRIGRQICREVGKRRVDRRLNIAGRTVDVAINAELENDAGLPEAAGRGHFRDMGDLAEVPFERACQA